jgi:hypothetical protein
MAQTWFVKDGKNVYNKGVGMKVYVYEDNSCRLAFKKDKCVWFKRANEGIRYDFIGELDLDIQQPKKTVRKEVHCSRSGNFEWQASQFIPTIAKNIKITYEVDE